MKKLTIESNRVFTKTNRFFYRIPNSNLNFVSEFYSLKDAQKINPILIKRIGRIDWYTRINGTDVKINIETGNPIKEEINQSLKKLIRTEIKKILKEYREQYLELFDAQNYVKIRLVLDGDYYYEDEILDGVEPNNWGHNKYPAHLTDANLEHMVGIKLGGSWEIIDKYNNLHNTSHSHKNKNYHDDTDDGDIFDDEDYLKHDSPNNFDW